MAKGQCFSSRLPAAPGPKPFFYNFTGGPDGDQPIGGLAIDETGNLYGTAADGGDPFCTCGTVFRLPTSGGSDFNAAFALNNGNQPWGGINSWSYGTTYAGGEWGVGNVYEWTYGHHLLVKHVFNLTGAAGRYPLGELLNENPAGVPKMYGTTYSGGVGGAGAVYLLTESQYKYDVWLTSVLHSFSGPDGSSPGAGLVMDPAGNLYGTTVFGGADQDLPEPFSN